MTDQPERVLPGGLAMTPWMWRALWADLALPGPPPDVAHTLVDEVVDQLAPHDVAPATAQAALRRIRLLAAEHFLNDKGGRPDLKDGQLAPPFVDGQAFDLPLFAVTGPGPRRFVHPPLVPAGVRELFCPDDDTVLLPVHPQELAQRTGLGSPAAVLSGVRATAAGRTLRTTVDGCALQIKCDFAHVMLDRRYRPFSPKDARYGIATTQHLAPSGVGFFPEVLGVGDAERDMAAVVRLDQPHPPGPSGAYALPA